MKRSTTAGVAGLATLAVMSLQGAPPPKPSESIRELPLHGTTVVADDRGRLLSYEGAENRLTIWDAKGRREVSCRLDLTGESAGNRPALALSGGSVLVAIFSPDGTRLKAMDLSTCRITASRELKALVFGATSARDGWLLRLMDPSALETRFLLLDFRLRTYAQFDVSEDVASLADADAAADSKVQDRMSTGFSVAGEVWVIPSCRYLFLRPRQKGKEVHSFEPPDCLASKGRFLSREEVRAEAIEMARKFEKDPELGPIFRQRAESANPGRTISAATARAAVNGRWVGVAVRDERGCRLDVWDMDSEAPAAVTRIGSACPDFFTFNEERALVLDENGFSEAPFPEPLGLPLKRPCDAEAAPKARSKPSEKPAEDPSAPKPTVPTTPTTPSATSTPTAMPPNAPY